jgi:HSP20 family protein
MAGNGISPLRDFMYLRDAMDRFFEDRWVSPGSMLTFTGPSSQSLPMDIYETADDFVLRVLVPGVKPDDIDVQYQSGTLTLRTKLASFALPEDATSLLSEIGGGQAIRQISLPRAVDVEEVTTTFEDGVLTLVLPKSADAKPRQIKVEPQAQLASAATGN